MEEAFPKVPLERHGHAAIAMQIAVPFAVLRVGKVFETPVVHLLVPRGVFQVAGELIREQRGNESFIVRPPELHVMPVLLHGLVVDVSEIQNAAKLRVPTPRPHPVEHLASRA